MILPSNILRHEFIGLFTDVLSAPNPTHKGISGTIIDETRQMFLINSEDKRRMVPKRYAIFQVKLPDGRKVEVSGSALVMSPEKRVNLRLKNVRNK